MKLSNLKPRTGAIKKRKRVGRGPGSGTGTTAGRGSNGQNARTGAKFPIGFEGGQMPLTRSLPKRGFNNIFRIEQQVVNIGDIDKKASGLTTIDPQFMKTSGLIATARRPVKILGNGAISIPLTIRAHAFSSSALDKIQKANGKAEVIAFAAGAVKA
jgi:large subunit ribosomal protein L15